MHLKKMSFITLLIAGLLYFFSERSPEAVDQDEKEYVVSDKPIAQKFETPVEPTAAPDPHAIIDEERYELAKEELNNFSKDLQEIQKAKRQGPIYIGPEDSPYEVEKEYYEGLD
jgi:hypothetical protein